jgi:hypothetical protein
MGNRVLLAGLSAIVLWGLGAASGAAPDKSGGPAKDIPELKMLDRYVGEQQGTITDDKGSQKTSTGSSQWVASGHILLTKYKISDGTEGVILRTYDRHAKVYRFVQMDSACNGEPLVLEGTWDEPSKTFTYKPKEASTGAAALVHTSTFKDDGSEVWSFTLKDAESKVTLKISGVATWKK